MPFELWVLYGTWIIGYAIIAALLMTEYKVLYQKPLLTMERFVEDANRIKDDAVHQIQMCQSLTLLEQTREKYLSEHGLILSLFDKIELLPGEHHPEAGAYLKQARRLVRNKFKIKREELIPMSDEKVVDKILASPFPELAALVPRLKKIEGNIPIAELQDGLYHKVIFSKEIVEESDPKGPKQTKQLEK
jgi:hypothetical protein